MQTIDCATREKANRPWATVRSRPIRRNLDGMVDIAYYERRARRLRSRWVRYCVRSIVRTFVRFCKRRTAAAELHALDDRTLRDIGVVRADIPAIASGMYFRDETRRHRPRTERG